MKGSLTLFRLAFRNLSKRLSVTLAEIFVLEILAVVLLYFLNSTYGKLYQGIQDYNIPIVWHSIMTFSGIACILVICNAYLGFFLNRLAYELRYSITDLVLLKMPKDVPQIGQRIQEDLKRFGELSVEFWASVTRAAFKLPVFLGVIISLTHWYIGLIILVAIVAGTLFTRYVALRLVPLQAVQESNEAEFRQNLHALFFGKIAKQFALINKQIKIVSFAQSGLSQVFVLLPFIVLMPLYISKAIPMGQFFQSVNALGKIIDSLTVLIDNRQLIAQLESVLLRLQWLHKQGK